MSYNSLGTSINFVDKATVVPTNWVQDTNNVVYGLLGNGVHAPTSVADILYSLGISASGVVRSSQTATLGQTIFTGIPTYVPGQTTLFIYINGVRQLPSAYTETSSTSVTFSTGATSAGDVYEFEVFTNAILAGGYVLPIASSGSLGGIKVGTDFSIDGSGTLSLVTIPTNKGGTGLASTGTANQVLGVNSGGSALEYKTITAGTNISVVHGTNSITISSTAGGGTVTSVGLSLPAMFSVTGSPVTTSGTLTASLASQTANTFFAAPNGSAGVPTFRTIVSADLPTIGLTKGGTGLTAGGTANQILGMDNAAAGLEYKSLVAGANVTITHGTNSVTIAATGGGGGGGTVTSVGLSAPAIFSVSGSPVTTAGTLSFALTSQTANTVWAAPDSSAGNPTFRTLVNNDLPTVSTAKGGTNLTSIGTASQILGVNTGATGLEYKTLTAGSNITITPAAGSITIAATGGGGAAVIDDVLFWMSI